MEQSVMVAVGLPGQGAHFGLDPLSGLFLVLLAPHVLANLLGGQARSPAFWMAMVGIALTLLAADGFVLICGFGLAAGAFWMLAPRRPAGAVPLCGTFCLIAAVFLPAGTAAFLFLLSAGGLFSRAGSRAGSLSAGAGANLALYLLIRYGFVVMGGAAAPWWGVLLMVLGAAAALGGALGALLEPDMKALLAQAVIAQAGMVTAALGLALWAGAADNPALAALAVAAALFGLVAGSLVLPLLQIGASAIGAATGTTSLDWLGGLLRGMPRLGLLMVLGAAGLAALPPGPGFPALFLLLHAVFAAAAGGPGARLGFAALLVALGFANALGIAAALRLIGIGLLGRPRSLRAAAAEDAPRPVLIAMVALALCCAGLALLPQPVLACLRPVVALLVPNAPPVPLPYAPAPLVGLLLAAGAAAWAVPRRFGNRGARQVPPWNGGFGKPPVWLPFGDPTTQPTATGFVAELAGLLALPWSFNRLPAVPKPWRRWLSRRGLVPRLVARAPLAASLAVLAAVLLSFAFGRV